MDKKTLFFNQAELFEPDNVSLRAGGVQLIMKFLYAITASHLLEPLPGCLACNSLCAAFFNVQNTEEFILQKKVFSAKWVVVVVEVLPAETGEEGLLK